MKIYFPEVPEEGVATSFSFENDDEQNIFINWLESLEIDYNKTKIPSMEGGKMRYTTWVQVDDRRGVEEQGEEEAEAIEEEEVIEEEPKPKKPKKKTSEQPY